VDLIELTLNHGVFVVHAAHNLAEADAIPADWQPRLAVGTWTTTTARRCSGTWGAANRLTRQVTPALGLSRRGDSSRSCARSTSYRFIPTYSNQGWAEAGGPGDRPRN
jgi:hypothetical protein